MPRTTQIAEAPRSSTDETRPGYVRGVPWSGPPGRGETVAQIMARDRAAPPPATEDVKEAPRPRLPSLAKRDNADSPQVAAWPSEERGPAAADSGTNLPQTIGTSFTAAQFSDSGFVPPDTMGDVGPTQILVALNGRIKVFSKAGVLGGLNTTLNNFFASVGGNTNVAVDPHVRYDRLSDRWFVTAISRNNTPNDILVAASSGSTITNSTSFDFFSFQHDLVGPSPNADTDLFADYETLGVDRFALYIGANIFSSPTTFSNSTGFVVDKGDLISGMLTVTAFRGLIDDLTCVMGDGGPLTPQGVDNDDPQATEGYFIGVDWCLFGELVIRRVVNPGGTPSLSANLDVTVPLTSFPQEQPQPPPGPNLDALDDRLFAAAIDPNKITGAKTLWTAHNIEVNSSGVADPAGGRNGSRWYEIGSLTAAPSLIQSGTLFDPASTSPFGYWIPSVVMSGQGHMALGSSRASTDSSVGFASIAVAGRLRTDTLGAIQAATLAQGSTFLYDQFSPSPERWGDYSQTVIDPTDDQTMWTFQEFATTGNNWAVRVIQLKAPPPATPVSASPSKVPVGASSIDVVVTGNSISGSEFFDPGPDTGGPGFANDIQASISGGVTVNSISFDSPTQLTLNISTAGATAGVKDVTVTNPDGQSESGPSILTVQVPASITLTPPSGSNDVEGDHTVTANVTDEEPLPVPGVVVRFSVAGANSAAGSQTTDASGNATFTYTGSRGGNDTITAFADTNGDGVRQSNEPQATASKLWIVTLVIPEGATHSGLTTFLTLANPSDTQSSTVDVTFLTPAGPVTGPQNLVVGPGQRRTINVNTTLGSAADVASKVVAEGDIVAEVSMHRSGSLAVMDMAATEGASSTWILPEGVTHSGFTTFVTIANPNLVTATHVDIDYLTGSGLVDGADNFSVPAGGRATVAVNSPLVSGGCGCSEDVSTLINVVGTEPQVVAGLSVHKQGTNDLGIGGSLGVSSTESTWVVAEGVTHSDFNTFILLANPGATSATAQLTFLTGSAGSVAGPTVVIPAGARRTVAVDDIVAADDVSTLVQFTSGEGAVESSVQKQDATGFVIADSVGSGGSSVAAASGTRWATAEGVTHSGFTTFVSIANPGVTAATVDVTFLTGLSGPVLGPQNLSVPAGGRRTVVVDTFVPADDVATLVEATSGAVVVELTYDKVSGGFLKGRSLATRLAP